MSVHEQCAELIGERLAVIVERSGQRGSPKLSFDKERTRRGKGLGGEPVWSPAIYNRRTDTIVVNLDLVDGTVTRGAGEDGLNCGVRRRNISHLR